MFSPGRLTLKTSESAELTGVSLTRQTGCVFTSVTPTSCRNTGWDALPSLTHSDIRQHFFTESQEKCLINSEIDSAQTPAAEFSSSANIDEIMIM